MTHASCRQAVITRASSASKGEVLHASDFDQAHKVPTDYVLALFQELANSGAGWIRIPGPHDLTVQRPENVIKFTPSQIMEGEGKNASGLGVKGSNRTITNGPRGRRWPWPRL